MSEEKINLYYRTLEKDKTTKRQNDKTTKRQKVTKKEKRNE